MGVEESTALKVYTNITSPNVVKTNKFQNQNKSNSTMAAYSKIIEYEKTLEVGNVEYKLVDKETNNETKHHGKTLDDPLIDLDEDIGSLTGDLVYVPAEGFRINIQDGVAKSIEDVCPDILHRVSEKYPKLCLTDHILVAHVKTCLDGTRDESTYRKTTDRNEVDQWLPGTYCLLQIDILFQDGSRAVLWKGEEPNSIWSNPPFALFKADEGNRASVAYLVTALDRETQELKSNYMNIKVSVKEADVKQGNEIEKDLNMEANMDYQNQEYDEVVKQESLDKFKSQNNNEAKSVENLPEVIVSQRFIFRITRTVDEKLSTWKYMEEQGQEALGLVFAVELKEKIV